MQGDDLTIALFLVGLAATFFVAAMTQAGWKHRILIISLFAAATVFLISGIAWPWIKNISPTIGDFIKAIATSGVSWFTIILLALGAILFRPSQNKSNKSQSVETYLRLQFGSGTAAPLAIDQKNIWRWYTLSHVMVPMTPGAQLSAKVTTTLFLMFDTPISIKQFRIDSGGANLPYYEVKDYGERHAIIAFVGEVPPAVVEIRPILQVF